MAKQRARDLYEVIHPYIEQYAEENYGGSEPEGFRHWAFHECFLEHDLSDSDIMDMTAIDASDDFEVDGYFAPDSEEDKVIHLFQSKFRQPGTNMGDKEMSPFLEAPTKLLNKTLVSSCHNEETKNLHDLLLDRIPYDYSLNLIWVTTGNLSQRAKTYAEENATRVVSVQIGDTVYKVKTSFTAYDLRDLHEKFKSHRESDAESPCDYTFEVTPGNCHQVGGDFPTILLTLPASQIIKVFRKHQYKIFKLNPRGPLGNKINEGIKDTLLDPGRRHMFHLLNNGLSATCNSYRLEGNRLQVRDFQIVNGCQTTVTLWETRTTIQNDPSVLVNLKLIECSRPQTFHKDIARATNTQAPLRSEDFVSTDPIHGELQTQFDSMRPPWFYEVKRGEWSTVTPSQKEKYRISKGKFRRLKVKDVAQYLAAFLGFPGEAKDDIRLFFGGSRSISSEYGEIRYKELYKDGLSAPQLLLPSLMHMNVAAKVAQQKENYDWTMTYARLHFVWVMGEIMRRKYDLPSLGIFSKEHSQLLIDSIDQWFERLYTVSLSSIANAVILSRSNGTYKGNREFFRVNPNSHRFIRDYIPVSLTQVESMGQGDLLSVLPN